MDLAYFLGYYPNLNKNLIKKLNNLPKSLIWVTLINYGYINYTKNFLKSMEKSKSTFKLIIFCIDKQSYDELIKYDNCICLYADFLHERCLVSELKVWEEIDYKKIVFAKLDVILYTLKNTYDIGIEAVGYIDTDIVLFSDPTIIMLDAMNQNKDINIFSQCDESGDSCSNNISCQNICSGVLVIRNIKEIYNIFEYTSNDINTFYGDQQFLTSNLKKLNIICLTISKNIFLNGSYFHKNHSNIFPSSACLIHFNYMVGNQKQLKMIQQQLWYI